MKHISNKLYNPTKAPLQATALQVKNLKTLIKPPFMSLTLHPTQNIIFPAFRFRSPEKHPNPRLAGMAGAPMKSAAMLLLVLNFCMYAVVLGIGGWAMNKAIDHGFIIGPELELPAHFSPIYFPMGNAATGFFVTFALIAGVVGVASVIAGLNHIRLWSIDSLPGAASAATIAWSLTLLAMGFAWKEIRLNIRNSRLKTMEAFLIMLSVTQLLYIAAIHGAATVRR